MEAIVNEAVLSDSLVVTDACFKFRGDGSECRKLRKSLVGSVNRVNSNFHMLTPLQFAVMQDGLLIEILTKLKIIRE